MTKVIVEKINTNTVNVIGKTIDSVSYSGDKNSRNAIKRAFITTEDVDENMTVRNSDDTVIRKVEKADSVEVAIQLLNAENITDGKSLATAVLRNVWTASDVENADKDMIDVYVMSGTNCEALDEIIGIAQSLSSTPTGERAFGKWYPLVNGKRAVIRIVAEICDNGKVKGSDCCC